MRIGFHISIAGGFKNILERAKQRGCTTIQLFSRNPRGWKYNPLDEDDITLFKQEMKNENIAPVFVHMPYLPNLASSKTDLRKRSLDSLIEDLIRSEKIGAQYLIMHIGSSEDKDTGLRLMVDGINQALLEVGNTIILLLENTAGSGNELGFRFEEIRAIIDGVDKDERIGLVLDTAHAFEAGYDLATREAVSNTVAEFDKIIGLKKLHLIHLNDSKTKLGSHSDRHWHIGKGEIGKGLGYLLNHRLLRDKPFIMETPRTNLKEDLMNMKVVRRLLARLRDKQ